MEINIQTIICDPSYFLREIPVQLDLLSQNVHQTLINHPAIWQMLSSLHKLYLYSLGNPLSGKKIITFNYSTIKLKRTTFTHFTYFPKLTVVDAKKKKNPPVANMLMCMLKETIRGIFFQQMINLWLSELGLDTGIAPNYNSPYNSNKISSKQVMRIMKNFN